MEGVTRIPEEEWDKRKEILEGLMANKSSKISNRHQSTHPGSSEHTKHDNYQKSTPKHIIFKLQNTKHKEKNMKKKLGGGWGHLLRRIRIRRISTSCQKPWNKILQLLNRKRKKKALESIQWNYPSKVNGKIKTSSDKQKLRELSPAADLPSKNVLQTEGKWYTNWTVRMDSKNSL